MRWLTTNKTNRIEALFPVHGTQRASAHLASRIGRQFLRHVLPLMLMMIMTGWLTLKASEYIEQNKPLPTYGVSSNQ